MNPKTGRNSGERTKQVIQPTAEVSPRGLQLVTLSFGSFSSHCPLTVLPANSSRDCKHSSNSVKDENGIGLAGAKKKMN